MSIHPLILWTDLLLYLLVFAVIIFVLWAKRKKAWQEAWKKLSQNKLAMAALTLLMIYIGIGLIDSIHFQIVQPQQNTITESLLDLLATPVTKYDEKSYSAPFASHLFTQDLILQPDGKLVRGYLPLLYKYHVLGTDKIGDDVLYETLKSIRTGLVIGTLTTLVMLPFAIILGMLAGYFRGWLDDGIQYIYITLSSVPDILLIAAAILAWQIFMINHPLSLPTLLQRADVRLLTLCFILGITSWTGLCRLLRAETLKLREMDYVQAARALGVSNTNILARHILPNLMHLILINVVIDFSILVLAEAVLTYVGVGVDPATRSWGNMIFAARQELARDPIIWWPIFAAFLFMFPLVISANIFADAVRDALDPRSVTTAFKMLPSVSLTKVKN